MTPRLAFICAGGTGGHLFPAESLAHALSARGLRVHLVTDERAERFAGRFPADETHIVKSATFASKNPVAMMRAAMRLFGGYLAARKLIRTVKPNVAIGFGGYPTIPPIMAATALGVPSLVHEQNAVMGRANRLLASRVDVIAGGFLPAGRGQHGGKIVETGNPVRPDVLTASEVSYAAPVSGAEFNLLVFGGSQGAHYFSEVLPATIERLPEGTRQHIKITQQARPEDAAGVEDAYRSLGIAADVSPFFDDMANRIAAAHLVISRSGASTVSELSVIGRPAILVPYPYALDHDQAANAEALEEKGGALLCRQDDLDPDRLCAIIGDLMNDSERLSNMAVSAKAAGSPDASDKLADLVVAVAEGRTVDALRENKQ